VTRAHFLKLLVIILCCQSVSAFAGPNPTVSCSPDLWKQPGETGGAGVQALLRNVPLNTKWADLPAKTKAQLRTHAPPSSPWPGLTFRSTSVCVGLVDSFSEPPVVSGRIFHFSKSLTIRRHLRVVTARQGRLGVDSKFWLPR